MVGQLGNRADQDLDVTLHSNCSEQLGVAISCGNTLSKFTGDNDTTTQLLYINLTMDVKY